MLEPRRPIGKRRETLTPGPNLLDYEAARRELDGLPDGRGLNIAHEAVDRHATGARADRVAIRWLGKDGAVRDVSVGP